MKTIGLLGGMSWESTVPYYRLINQRVGERLGGLHSAKIVLYSVDFHEIEVLQHADRWEEAGELLAAGARSLERAGADFLVLCTNTMHRVAGAIEAAVRLPLLHIADATAAEIARAGMRRVGLLGTRFTMEQEFYSGRLQEHGLEVLTPGAKDRALVHRVIYEELCRGEILPASRREYERIVESLVEVGAEGVILGCTEISLLVPPGSSEIPLFDTTAIHARAAADFALEGEEGEGPG
ncbi:MAG TPA: aspartate/glutamate racemase family protein [Thermoanaerobaculia bacterium]|nr:aspartate/glutamate racemase family protein [Thermoanaerobaculia bacterium]